MRSRGKVRGRGRVGGIVGCCKYKKTSHLGANQSILGQVSLKLLKFKTIDLEIRKYLFVVFTVFPHL